MASLDSFDAFGSGRGAGKNRGWYASRLDQYSRVKPSSEGGTDPDLYAKIKQLEDSGTLGTKNVTITAAQVRELASILGSHPNSDIGRVLRHILADKPENLAVVPLVDDDGSVSAVNLVEYLDPANDWYQKFAPKAYKFDKDFGGYDADKAPWMYSSPEEKYQQSVADVSSVGRWPAPLTEIPTSTVDPSRPRTVAAGHDGYRKVLTVMFRDGSIYNYYGVSNLEWGRFLGAPSKGKFIKNFLDSKVRGLADTAGMPASARETLYKVSRASQERTQGGYYGKYRKTM